MKQTKPTVDTKFYINLDWWQRQGRNLRVEMVSHLCVACRDSLSSSYVSEMVDWVDPDTAGVSRVDALWHSLRSCCSQRSEFLSSETSLATAIFRAFLANGNEPLSSVEIWQRLSRRDPATILRLLVSGRSYYGIEPADGAVSTVREGEASRRARRDAAGQA